MSNSLYVSDRAPGQISNRFEDADGRLFVSSSIISKPQIDAYKGSEIEGWERWNLDPDRIYNLFRAPDELAKAAPRLRNQPLLSEHAPLSSDSHKSDLTIGSVSDGLFEDGVLKASLAVWREPFIQRIKDGTQKEISMAYRFDPDMTPGTWQGKPYDGVMRNIRPNHVAIVPAGRVNINGVGPAAAVADSANGVTMAEEKTGGNPLDCLVDALRMFAPDVDDDKLRAAGTQLIAALNSATPGAMAGDEGACDGKDTPKPGMANDESAKAKKEHEAAGGRKANEVERGERIERKRKDHEDERKGEEKAERKGATAMDAAALTAQITASIEKKFSEARQAERDVAPVVGVLGGLAMDSAPDIYGAALKQKGVDVTGVDPSAFKGMWKALAPSFARPATPAPMAQDSSPASAPDHLGMGRLRNIGSV